MAKRKNKKRRRHPEAAPIGWLTPEKLREVWEKSEETNAGTQRLIEDPDIDLTEEDARGNWMHFYRSEGAERHRIESWRELWEWYTRDRRGAEIQIYQAVSAWASDRKGDAIETAVENRIGELEGEARDLRDKYQAAMLVMHECGVYPDYDQPMQGDLYDEWVGGMRKKFTEEQAMEALRRNVEQGWIEESTIEAETPRPTEAGRRQVWLRAVFQWLNEKRPELIGGGDIAMSDLPDYIQNFAGELFKADYVSLQQNKLLPTEKATATMTGRFWRYWRKWSAEKAPPIERANEAIERAKREGRPHEMVECITAVRDLLVEGHQASVGILADRLGWDREKTRRISEEAMAADLLAAQITGERDLHTAATFDPARDGLLWLPTATVARFSKLAREAELPGALTDDEVAELPAFARHIILSADIGVHEGKHYVIAEIMLQTTDPERLERVNPEEIVDELLNKVQTDPVTKRWQAELIRRGTIQVGELRSAEINSDSLPGDRPLTFREPWLRDHLIEQFRGARRMTKPDERTVAFPLLQFGLLADTARPRDDTEYGDLGEEMPVHGGSHSFEPVWHRLTERANRVDAVVQNLETWRRTAPAPTDLETEMDGSLWQSIEHPEAAQGVMAHKLLRGMRRARVITVGLDIAEGLPDWESVEECWRYAKTANLPFKTLYLDFTTAGGFAPKLGIAVNNVDHPEEDEMTVSLRGALVQNTGIMTVTPFTWLDDAIHPTPEGPRTTWDPIGTVHFGSDGPPDPIMHVRQAAVGTSAPLTLVRNEPLLNGEPGYEWGYTEIADDLQAVRGKNDAIARASASIALAAASRALSVLHALESVANIDLADAKATRPQRREVERAQKKGKVKAEISLTVEIKQTRADHGERENGNGEHKRYYSHAHWRRGTYAHYPLGTRIADALAEAAPDKLVDHPEKGLCRRIYRGPTIVGRYDEDGNEREPVHKSYVWKDRG